MDKLEQDLATTIKAIADIEAAMAPYKARLEKLIQRKEQINEKIYEAKADDLAFIMFQIHAHEQWSKLLPANTYVHGYWANEYENGFQLVLKHKIKEYPHIVEFINRWLPLSKAKKIGILRHDCAEQGIWQCEFDDKSGKWEVADIRSYWPDRVQFDTVEAMLAHVAEHHSFDGSDLQREDRW